MSIDLFTRKTKSGRVRLILTLTLWTIGYHTWFDAWSIFFGPFELYYQKGR